jgi:ribosomal-protein-alanine N-acetyltransferase
MSAEPDEVLTVTRAMGEADLPDVVSVEGAAYDFPWSERVFMDCLRMGYDCAVQLATGRVVGYLILSCVADEAHVLNLAVHPTFQNEGRAGSLLRRAMRQARQFGAASIYLEVRPSNPGAIHLYHRAGFRLVGRRRDYYPTFEGREDALVMRRELPRLSALT